MTLAQMIVVALCAFIIGFGKAGVGGGLGPLITLLMLLVYPPQTALALLLPLLIVGDAFAISSLWKQWSSGEVVLLLPGALIGVATGTYVVTSISADGLRLALGLVALGFVAYFLLRPRFPTSQEPITGRWPGWLAGGGAGLVSALAHSGAPPLTIYLLLRRLEPVKFVATTVLVFTAINLIKVPAYAAAGLFDWELQARLWWSIPLIPLGVLLGRRMVGRIDQAMFQKVIVSLLAITALFLIFD